MTVRLKLALTVVATGLVTLLLVVATVLYAFRRFEYETEFRRGNAFLQRVVAMYDNLFELHQQRPQEFAGWLRTMVLFEPDTQLYLLDPAGIVLATSGSMKLAPGFKVAIAPVREALMHPDMPYVMGDDPERMDANAVIAVQPVRRAGSDALAGYLYLVAHTEQPPADRWAALRASVARPVMWLIVAVVAATTVLAALIIAAVTRPLGRLTDAVARLSERSLDETLSGPADDLLPPPTRDEFGQLTRAFSMMLATLRRQWGALRRLDHFRREGVSNLSHDLRSPLTATVACLETLEQRWAGDAARDDERRLVEVALRNTRNAAGLVQSLGDLAQLDEPTFKLRVETVDAAELLDDIALRFADRAAQRGITLRAVGGADAAPAALDVELFERAIANLVDNALKFCAPGASITLDAVREEDGIRIRVADTGAGIAPEDVPHLFDRFYQSRHSVAPATGEGGKGLGLAIVKRIVELHGGEVSVDSVLGRGTMVVLALPIVTA